jgi:cysteine sulfinate desulfinase/cysteine desulfurase-like protein
LAVGLTEVEANQSLRISMGRQTTAEQLDQFAATLKALIVRKQ